MSIYGRPSGYGKDVWEYRSTWVDLIPDTEVEVKRVNTRVLRVDIPADLYEALEIEAENLGLSTSSGVIKLLRQGLASSERR